MHVRRSPPTRSRRERCAVGLLWPRSFRDTLTIRRGIVPIHGAIAIPIQHRLCRAICASRALAHHASVEDHEPLCIADVVGSVGHCMMPAWKGPRYRVPALYANSDLSAPRGRP